jgi:hypothetical protein
MSQTSPKSRIKKFIIAGVILLVIGAGAAWYIFTETFTDTATQKATFTVNAYSLIKEFQTDIA